MRRRSRFACTPAVRQALLLALWREERVRELAALGWGRAAILAQLAKERWPPSPFHVRVIYPPPRTKAAST